MLEFSHISTNVKLVLHGLNWKEWLAYLDAVIVHVNSFDNHLCNIRYVLIRSRQHNLKLKQKNGVCSKRCYRCFGQGGQWGWCIRDHGENILCSSVALPTKSKRYGYFFRAHELSQGTHLAQLWLCLDTIWTLVLGEAQDYSFHFRRQSISTSSINLSIVCWLNNTWYRCIGSVVRCWIVTGSEWKRSTYNLCKQNHIIYPKTLLRERDWLYSHDNSNSTFSVGPLLLAQITTA